MELPAIIRQLKRSAHFVSRRFFLISGQGFAVKLGGNLLIISIFGFLQFPPVGHKRLLAVPVIHEIDFCARHRKCNRACRREEVAHFLPLFITFSATAAPAVASMPAAWISTTHASTTATVTAFRILGVLSPLARVVAVIRI